MLSKKYQLLVYNKKRKVDKEIESYEAKNYAALGTFNVTSKHQFIIGPQIFYNGKYKHQHINKYLGKKKGQDKDFP